MPSKQSLKRGYDRLRAAMEKARNKQGRR